MSDRSESLPTPGSTTPASWRFVIATFLLAASGLVVNYALTLEFDERNAYDDWETMFYSDPNWYLPRLAEGTYTSKRHPLFGLMVHPPVSFGAEMLAPLTGEDKAELRRSLVLAAPPLFGALKTVGLMLLALELGVSLPLAVLVAIVDIASLSRLVFGTMPESYGATSTVLVWGLYLAARTLKSRQRISYGSWFLCGLLAFGVTITNIVWVGILMLAALRPNRDTWFPALVRCGVLCIAVVVVGGALHLVGAGMAERKEASQKQSGARQEFREENVIVSQTDSESGQLDNVSPYVKIDVLRSLRLAPAVVASTFAAPPPRARERSISGGSGGTRRQLRPARGMDLEWIVLIAIISASLVLGARGFVLVGGAMHWIGAAVLMILLFNGAMFSVWGSNQAHLFTLHWQPCLLLTLLGAGLMRGKQAKLAAAAVVVLLVAQLLWNYRFIEASFRVLETNL